MTLHDRLLAKGIGREEIRKHIFRAIYPIPRWLWWKVRLALGFNPYCAEWEFVNDLINARHISDVEVALMDYHSQQPEYKALFLKPSRRRVRAYFRQVMGNGID